ncbi:Cysteine desulfurase 1, mitochondrial [Hordeum vulgare]|nr:Cysteine desulfurase 1, mitochondrial [Hordeum vulgare]
MLPFYLSRYGNPHSRTHLYGWESDAAVEEARASVARLIGADPREIFFTSGATECNNIAVKGVMHFYRDRRRHIITTQTEHKTEILMSRMPACVNPFDKVMYCCYIVLMDGHIEIMKVLLGKGVDVESESESGTPLVWATGHGQQDAVKLLLEHNAKPDTETADGITSLLSAVAAGSLPCLEVHAYLLCFSPPMVPKLHAKPMFCLVIMELTRSRLLVHGRDLADDRGAPARHMGHLRYNGSKFILISSYYATAALQSPFSSKSI